MRKFLLIVCSLAVAGCSPDKGRSTRAFPEARVPAMYTEQKDVLDYLGRNYWNDFFRGGGVYLCDSTHILGVEEKAVAAHLVDYISLLGKVSLTDMDAASGMMAGFFAKVEEYQRYDTLSNAFSEFSAMLSQYLYDPNSPVRDESLYCPVAEALAVSSFTPDDLRESRRYEARMSRLNMVGTVAVDFEFVTSEGASMRMHDIKAPYKIVAFVNPGCHACGEMVAAFSSEEVSAWIGEGSLKVLDIYIDGDLEAWREHLDEIPPCWISGYDPSLAIRADVTYDVRAIPSLYLLGEGDKVIMKDAPEQKILNYLRAAL